MPHKVHTSFVDVWHCKSNERTLPPLPMGDVIELRSTITNRATGPLRSWYLQGEFGSLHWPDLYQDDSLRACEETLQRAGYVAQGTLPPECFEYRTADVTV
jgi:hypothetical protein